MRDFFFFTSFNFIFTTGDGVLHPIRTSSMKDFFFFISFNFIFTPDDGVDDRDRES